MAKQFFKNLPDTSTPLTANRLNGLLDGEEAMGNLVVDSIRTKNLYNISNETKDKLINSSGVIVDNTAFNLSDYIEINSNAIYTFSWESSNAYFQVYIAYYDNNKSFISRQDLTTVSTYSKSFTTLSNAKYIRITYAKEVSGSPVSRTNIQLEEGDTASTYSPYQNLTGEENYSTNEIKIGTYLGKPLYRKVITRTVNANTNDNVSLSTLGITNQDTIIINTGLSTAHYQISTTGGGYAPIVYYVSNTDRAHVYVNANKELQIQNQNNNQREYNIVLEYTKTTN